MTRSLPALGLCIALLSCSKKDNSKPLNNTPAVNLAENTWTAGGTRYTADEVSRNSFLTELRGTDRVTANVFHECSITFTAYPTASGTYTVVANPVNPNDLGISVLVNDNGVERVYMATGTDGQTAAVTVTNGKIRVQVPPVWARQLANSDDSLKVAAHIVEQ